MAKGQLAIEELLLMAHFLEFAGDADGGPQRLMADVQDLLIGGLEAVRGAFDCSATPRARRIRNHESQPSAAGNKLHPDDKDYQSCVELYLSLFVVGRLTVWALSAYQVDERGKQSTWDWLRHQKGFSGPAFINLWAALNQSVGLSGRHQVFNRDADTPPQRGGSSWLNLLSLVEDAVLGLDATPANTEPLTIREIALRKRSCMHDKRFVQTFLERSNDSISPKS